MFSHVVRTNGHDRLASLFTPDSPVRMPVGSIEAGILEFFLQTTHPRTIPAGRRHRDRPGLPERLARLRDGGSHINCFAYHDRYQRTSDDWKFTERCRVQIHRWLSAGGLDA